MSRLKQDSSKFLIAIEPPHEKTLFTLYANSKGADWPAHACLKFR